MSPGCTSTEQGKGVVREKKTGVKVKIVLKRKKKQEFFYSVKPRYEFFPVSVLRIQMQLEDYLEQERVRENTREIDFFESFFFFFSSTAGGRWRSLAGHV